MPRRHRALTAAVALAVATAAIGLTVRAFLGTGERSPVTTPAPIVPKANGAIWFRVGGGDAPSFIYEINPDGTGQRLVFGSESDPLRYSQIAWSPDGSRITYIDPIVGKRGVYVSDPDGVDPRQLTYGVNDGWPAWSPDGTRIAFSSTRYDPNIEVCTPAGDFLCPTDIYVMDANGSNVKRLTYDPVPEYHPVWSPDGTKIAFVQTFNGTATAIYAMNSDGTDVRQVSSHDGGSDFSPSWSPDGSRIVFSSIRFEDWRIFVVNPDGTDEHSILDSGGFVDQSVWSPDGKLIAFVGSGFGGFPDGHALYVMRPDGSDIRRLSSTDLEYGVAGDTAWQPLPATTPGPTPSETPPASVDPNVASTMKVGEDVRSVIYGAGSIWVAVSSNDGSFGGSIVRIDPTTGETLGSIPVESVPTWELGGGAMAVGDGSLWVTGGIEAPGGPDAPGGGSDATLIRIDPVTNEVVDTIILGGTVGADVAVDGSGVWVLLFGDERVDHRMEVVRIDPATGEVVARIPLEARWAHTLVASDGRILVNDGGHLTSIDPSTNRIAANETIPLRYSAWGPVVWQGQLWLAVGDAFRPFDPHTARPTGEAVELDPAETAVCCLFIASGDSGIWFGGYDGVTGQGPPRLTRFDPATGRIEGFMPLDQDTPVAMAVAPDSVWVLGYGGTLTHIELS